ncbi:MAG: ABC transporter permease, partial [Burkholderiales bacterium]|nr:ABC transporter permease [Burkholderiales bacterium]
MSYFDTMVTAGWGFALLRATLTTLAVSILALLVGALIGPLVAWGKLGPVRALRGLA